MAALRVISHISHHPSIKFNFDARSSRARSAPRSSGTTSSCTAPSPGWFSPKLYFPNPDPLVGTLQAFGIYAVGFIARPVGAAISATTATASAASRP